MCVFTFGMLSWVIQKVLRYVTSGLSLQTRFAAMLLVQLQGANALHVLVQDTLLRICCAMLILVRRRLLAGDFTANIQLLQHYPATNIDHLLHIANRLRGSVASQRYILIFCISVPRSCLCGGVHLIILRTQQRRQLCLSHFGVGVAGSVVAEESIEALDAFLVVFTLETSPLCGKSIGFTCSV